MSVLLTGVGKRYDVVSAFAQHDTTVGADPNPLAPAQYAAHSGDPADFVRPSDTHPPLHRLSYTIIETRITDGFLAASNVHLLIRSQYRVHPQIYAIFESG